MKNLSHRIYFLLLFLSYAVGILPSQILLERTESPPLHAQTTPSCEEVAKAAAAMLDTIFAGKIGYQLSCSSHDMWVEGMTDGGSYSVMHPLTASETALARSSDAAETKALDLAGSIDKKILKAHGFPDWREPSKCLNGYVRAKEGYIEEFIPKNPNWGGFSNQCRAVYAERRKQVKELEPEPVAPPIAKEPPTVWPSIVSAHIVLNSVQAKEQDHPIPVCTEQSTTTCYDPTLPNLNWHEYAAKANCERYEGVKCASTYERDDQRWVPIGKPVVYDESEQK
jgi:hypothetical protein